MSRDPKIIYNPNINFACPQVKHMINHLNKNVYKYCYSILNMNAHKRVNLLMQYSIVHSKFQTVTYHNKIYFKLNKSI